MTETHRLTNKDLSTLTATCSVCGPVGIRKSGTGHQCAIKKSQAFKDWASANPEKAAVNRRRKSEHILTRKDRQNMTARCQKCGDVKLVPWGRGVICGNLAGIRRTVQESSSRGACRECWLIDGSKVWLRGDGSCPACSAWSPSLEVRPEERRDPGDREAGELKRLGFYEPGEFTEAYGSGFSVAGDLMDPYQIEDYDSAVPGWRTLGSERPWNEVG